MRLALTSDVVIFLGTPLVYEYIIPRLKQNKLSFEYSERWFKRLYKLNLLSPRLWRYLFFYYKYGESSNLYMLSAGAYVPNDVNFLRAYKNRCFKWAYFTKVSTLCIDDIIKKKRNKKIQIMWCSRFITWKHPELMIKLAQKLLAENYQFDINMYGNGPLIEEIKREIYSTGISHCVHIMGSAPNEEILRCLQMHHMLLFTSDQNEGWGAIANEAMSNGCTLIGSNKIGAVPYLVKDGLNGLIFKSCNINSLYIKVKSLIDNQSLRESLALRAYHDMSQTWSPECATQRFLKLVEVINNGVVTPFNEGPCSYAEPTNYSDYGS